MKKSTGNILPLFLILLALHLVLPLAGCATRKVPVGEPLPEFSKNFLCRDDVFTFQEELKTKASGTRFYSQYHVVFPSAVSTPHENNNNVSCEYFVPTGKAAGAVIVVPGYNVSTLVERSYCGHLAQRGFCALMLRLPYQEDRAHAGQKSLAWTISSDMDHNERVLIQMEQDIGRAKLWLQREKHFDSGRIGLFGLSMGGFVASIAYSVDGEYSACVLALNGAKLSEAIWNDSWLLKKLKDALRKKGYTRETLQKRCKNLDPIAYARPHRKTGLLMFGSSDDEIIPPDSIRSLALAYGGAETLWLKGAHIPASLSLVDHMDHIAAHYSAQFGR